jgi:hypothetical protein
MGLLQAALAGGVIAAVLAQVAFLSAVVDLGCDDGSIGDQLIRPLPSAGRMPPGSAK